MNLGETMFRIGIVIWLLVLSGYVRELRKDTFTQRIVRISRRRRKK